MTMILGVWVTSVEAYQRLALKLAQQEVKRSQLRKELDVFETQERARSAPYVSGKTLINEPTRMSSRNRAMRNTAQPAIKDKR